jgi:hypothetical protein
MAAASFPWWGRMKLIYFSVHYFGMGIELIEPKTLKIIASGRVVIRIF